MRKSLTLSTCLVAMAGFSQVVTDTIKPIKLSVVELQTERYSKSNSKTSQKIETISQKEIEFQNFQNTADLLSNSGTLSIQKSQQGGGSPVIRGFEANRILLLVDGIRMNNLIFRAGHLQNVITIDENMLSKVDVLFGPSSTVFGSDAMGGAINLQTKMPLLFSENNKKTSSGNAITRFSSSNNEKSGYFDFNLSGIKWGSLTAVSYNDFGDLRMGRQRNGSNDFFGERNYYIETVNNVDNLVVNSDKYLQKFSAYKQYNLMQKLVYQQDKKSQHSINFQFSTTSNIPRYDRLTDLTTTGLKYARWDYGPQKRLLAAYKFTKDKAFLNSDLSLGLSYQNVEESRITRKFNANNTKSQIEKVSVYSVNADFKTKIGKGELLYGAEIFYDNLNSSATKSDRTTGIVSPTDSRYPNGKNSTFRNDFFATYSGAITKNTAYNLGARAGFVTLNSTIADTSFFNLPFNCMKQNNFTYSGAAGIVNINKNTRIAFNLASAYRIPNIDDIAKIFESGAGILIVPNQNLKPEKSVTADLNLELWEGKKVQFGTTFYYTRLFNAIITDHFLFNGSNSIIYENQTSTVFANQNKGIAYTIGNASTLKVTFSKAIEFYSTFNYTKGRINTGSGTLPLDHIPPFYGKIGWRYESKIINFDFYILYNGKKDIKDYYLNGEDNEQYAPANGIPSWKTFNFKGAVLPFESTSIFFGIENILDTQYRTFASGINASGRNLYVGAKYKF